MEENQYKEIAFFNLLKSLISPNIKNEELNYTIAIDDLKEKLEIDKQIISSLLNKLQDDGLVDILENTDKRLDLRFERTHEKLLEFLNVDDLDRVIKDIKKFISRHIAKFNFQIKNELFDKYARLAAAGIEEYGESFDMSDIIGIGVDDIFNREPVIIYVNKMLYEISLEAKGEDLQVLEGIFYCSLNLPPEENPFYITLFLTKLVFQMEINKRDMIDK